MPQYACDFAKGTKKKQMGRLPILFGMVFVGWDWAAQNGIQWWERWTRVLTPNRVLKSTETYVNVW